MAAQVLPVSSPPGGNFLEPRSPALLPPNSFLRDDSPESADGGGLVESDAEDIDSAHSCDPTTPLLPLDSGQPATPDSGFSGLVTSTPRKSPDTSAQWGLVADTPTSSYEAPPTGACRKRKTVNFDESQTSVVVISPGDLFQTYSQTQQPPR